MATFPRSNTGAGGGTPVPVPVLPAVAMILAALLLLVNGAGAATVPWIDLEEMTTRAEVIVLGRVEKVESAWTPDGGMIFTTATIEIEDGLKGAPWRRVTVRVPGGRIGDQRMVASGAPTFREGERLVVFLERPGAGGRDRGAAPDAADPGGAGSGGGPDRARAAADVNFSIVGWNLGKLPVRRNTSTGRDLVLAPSGDAVTYVGPDGRPIDRARGRRAPEELGQFLRRVRAILGDAGHEAAP